MFEKIVLLLSLGKNDSFTRIGKYILILELRRLHTSSLNSFEEILSYTVHCCTQRQVNFQVRNNQFTRSYPILCFKYSPFFSRKGNFVRVNQKTLFLDNILIYHLSVRIGNFTKYFSPVKTNYINEVVVYQRLVDNTRFGKLSTIILTLHSNTSTCKRMSNQTILFFVGYTFIKCPKSFQN